jgi:hypothetical protein
MLIDVTNLQVNGVHGSIIASEARASLTGRVAVRSLGCLGVECHCPWRPPEHTHQQTADNQQALRQHMQIHIDRQMINRHEPASSSHSRGVRQGVVSCCMPSRRHISSSNRKRSRDGTHSGPNPRSLRRKTARGADASQAH